MEWKKTETIHEDLNDGVIDDVLFVEIGSDKCMYGYFDRRFFFSYCGEQIFRKEHISHYCVIKMPYN